MMFLFSNVKHHDILELMRNMIKYNNALNSYKQGIENGSRVV
jgi:hypothetical protein